MSLQIIRQDITKMRCDAIVNTTNEYMVGYSGVDYAIHHAAGPLLDVECQSKIPLKLGFATYTKGYDLDCKYIIHTSGPIWRGGHCGEEALLKSCYIESLNLAKRLGCESVAFPLISSGVYGYPKDQVLKYAVQLISEFLFDNDMEVYLCVYDKYSYEFSRELYKNIKDYINDHDIDSDNISNNEDYRMSINMPAEKEKQYSVNCHDDLGSYINAMDKSFMETLFDYIDKRGITDVECYKRANVDKKAFSKLKNNPKQKPSKQTAVAFAIALELNMEETQHLLATAGLILSNSQKFDVIIKYFIEHKQYNIFEINEALFEFDQLLLGSK